ncbi:MAG: pyridoxal-phosphate dependent enzyme [Candidatus Melainabacteria bacterium]|nr:pyridoxal-phosphate dependent enzyme [Candidatus Melainabacteria bacterium]
MAVRTLNLPTITGIEAARDRLKKYLLKTPLLHSTSLSNLTGAKVYIKYENCNPTNAFKVRGGINFVCKLIDEIGIEALRATPLLAGSTGNHGQSIAYAGNLFNLPVIIACPCGSNPSKVQAIKDFGAKVIFYGKDVFETWEYCKKLAREERYYYVHSVEQRELFEGVGTIGLEVYEDLPEVDCFITAVGGGSGVCGSAIALKEKSSVGACCSKPLPKIYGVQSTGAPAVHDSFKQKKLITYPNLNTFAEGLATRNVYPYAYEIMQKYVDDIFLVSDEELKAAILLLLEHCHTLAEGAGAVSLAGLIKNKEIFQGKKVVCVLTGSNLQIDILREILLNRF